MKIQKYTRYKQNDQISSPYENTTSQNHVFFYIIAFTTCLQQKDNSAHTEKDLPLVVLSK